MYYKLALNNLKNQKTRTALTAAGVAIGTAALFGILAFSTGIKNAVIDTIAGRGPLTQITVEPPSQEGSFLKSLTTIASNKNKLTPETIETLKKIPHVETVSPQLNYDNISSLRVNIWNQNFQTDTMIFGLPHEFVEEDLPNGNEWKNPQEPYPALISRNIINLYNLTVAPSNNLPTFSEADIIGLEFTLMPGVSTFFPTISSQVPPVTAKIVGFSDKVDLIGVTLPLETVRKFNLEQYQRTVLPEQPKTAPPSPYTETYLKAYITVDDPKNVESAIAEIEKMGLKSRSTKLEIQVFENNFRIVTVGLGMIASIILLVSGLMIANTYLSSVNERKREIGLFRALGATRADIRKIFLAEASLLGFIGGLFGVMFAWLGGFVVDAIALSAFPDVTSKPDTLLYYDLPTMLGILLFAVVLSVVFAFLPSAKAARIEPLKALNG